MAKLLEVRDSKRKHESDDEDDKQDGKRPRRDKVDYGDGKVRRTPVRREIELEDVFDSDDEKEEIIAVNEDLWGPEAWPRMFKTGEMSQCKFVSEFDILSSTDDRYL
jgi:hypothetical protein